MGGILILGKAACRSSSSPLHHLPDLSILTEGATIEFHCTACGQTDNSMESFSRQMSLVDMLWGDRSCKVQTLLLDHDRPDLYAPFAQAARDFLIRTNEDTVHETR